jgi:hypothetical protein
MAKDRGFSHLRVVDLRLVRDRRDRWHLYVEGVEVHLFESTGPFGSGPAIPFAKYLAERINRTDTPFPVRLWSYFWFKKPWGHP